MAIPRIVFVVSVLILGIINRSLASTYDFTPESSSQITFPKLPVLVDVTTSILDEQAGDSFWTSSYITASNNHQYLVVTHTFFIRILGQAYVKASVLDITDPSYYRQIFEYKAPPVSKKTPDGRLRIAYSDFGFEGLSADSLSKMYTWSTNPVASYNITYDTTSTILYACVQGEFPFANGTTQQWAVPAAKTQGTITINGAKLDIIPEKSLTWFDRQTGIGLLDGLSWTWFEIHFPGSGLKISSWAIDYSNPDNVVRFATVRGADGIHTQLPCEVVPSTTLTYHSNTTGAVYPLQWVLSFPGGESLTVKSIRADQEIISPRLNGDTTYQGFVEVTGTLMGQSRQGYGLVEVVYM